MGQDDLTLAIFQYVKPAGPFVHVDCFYCDAAGGIFLTDVGIRKEFQLRVHLSKSVDQSRRIEHLHVDSLPAPLLLCVVAVENAVCGPMILIWAIHKLRVVTYFAGLPARRSVREKRLQSLKAFLVFFDPRFRIIPRLRGGGDAQPHDYDPNQQISHDSSLPLNGVLPTGREYNPYPG